MDGPIVLSPTAPRLSPRHIRRQSRSPSRSPTRPRITEDILSDLSPATTLDSFTNASGALRASIEAASPAQRAFGIRAAVASKKIHEWVTELSEWPWPTRGSLGFELPNGKRRKYLDRRQESRKSPNATTRNNTVSEQVDQYWGSLLADDVIRYETRIDEIEEDMDDLNVEEIKSQVLDTHVSSRSRPSSSTNQGAAPPPFVSYTRMDDFTAVITATVLQALPNLSRLMALMDVWSVRLLVLRQVVPLQHALSDAEQALKSGWKTLDTLPVPTSDSSNENALTRETYEVIRGVLQEKVTVVGQKLDNMLDTLEGRQDTIPETWLDQMETIEQDYGEWVVGGDRKVREGEWAKDSARRKLEKLMLIPEDGIPPSELVEEAGLISNTGEVTDIPGAEDRTAEQMSVGGNDSPISSHSTKLEQTESAISPNSVIAPFDGAKEIEPSSIVLDTLSPQGTSLDRATSPVSLEHLPTDDAVFKAPETSPKSSTVAHFDDESHGLADSNSFRELENGARVGTLPVTLLPPSLGLMSETTRSAVLRHATQPSETPALESTPVQSGFETDSTPSSLEPQSLPSHDLTSDAILSAVPQPTTQSGEILSLDSQPVKSELETHSTLSLDSESPPTIALTSETTKPTILKHANQPFATQFSEPSPAQEGFETGSAAPSLDPQLPPTATHIEGSRSSQDDRPPTVSRSSTDQPENNKKSQTSKIKRFGSGFANMLRSRSHGSKSSELGTVPTPYLDGLESTPEQHPVEHAVTTSTILPPVPERAEEVQSPLSARLSSEVVPSDIPNQKKDPPAIELPSPTNMVEEIVPQSIQRVHETSFDGKMNGQAAAAQIEHVDSAKLADEQMVDLIDSDSKQNFDNEISKHQLNNPIVELDSANTVEEQVADPSNPKTDVKGDIGDASPLSSLASKSPSEAVRPEILASQRSSSTGTSLSVPSNDVRKAHSRNPSNTSNYSTITGYSASDPSPEILEAATEYFSPVVSPARQSMDSGRSGDTTPTRRLSFFHPQAIALPEIGDIPQSPASSQKLANIYNTAKDPRFSTPKEDQFEHFYKEQQSPTSVPVAGIVSEAKAAQGHSIASYTPILAIGVPKSSVETPVKNHSSDPIVQPESPTLDEKSILEFPEYDESPSLGRVRIYDDTNEKGYSPPSSPPPIPAISKRRSLHVQVDPYDAESVSSESPISPSESSFLSNLDVSTTPILSHPSKVSDDQLQQQISEILESIPARIRLTSEPDISSHSELRPTRQRPSLNTSFRPQSRASTPSFTLAPAYAKSRRPRPQSGTPEIKLYHLSRSTGEAPIKLFVRLVGEHGERVMVRVGGGWADLGEYLKEYASHHGRRTDKGGKVEIQDLPSRNVSSGSTASVTTIRNTSNTGRSSPLPSSRPGSSLAFDRPMPALAIRKTRRSVGPADDIREGSYRSPSTPLSVRSRPQSRQALETPPSATMSARSISKQSWTEEESSLGLAGPKSRKVEISAENAAWVESMKEQVRIASAEKDRERIEKERRERAVSGGASDGFGELKRIGGTKRLFKKGLGGSGGSGS
jgi:hypothetical protein